MRRACVPCANLLCCCFARTWPACDHVGTQHQANMCWALDTWSHVKSFDLFWHILTSYQLAQSTPQYYFVLLRTTKLAQRATSYYFVLHSLHKVLPSTTSYYKACTTYFPVLLHITKLAQSTSQYYFVLQSLRTVLPSTTSYYKACTTYFPVLLRTTKLAQRTSQYYFVLQSLHNVLCSINLALLSLHKVLPSTTSYYKACTKYFPVLLRTTKLAQSASQ